jgi:hypothetical protein
MTQTLERATNFNMVVFRGEDLTLRFSVVDPDSKDVVDITGWTLTLHVRASLTGAAVLTKAGTITDAASGLFTITLSRTDTGTTITAAGDYYWGTARTDSGSWTVLSYGLMYFRDAGVA